MKLIITEHGDDSVGIPTVHYSLECPLEKDAPEEEKEAFRLGAIELYNDFSGVYVSAQYDYEIEAFKAYLRNNKPAE